MQQKRSRTVWIVAIVVAFFFFIDPFRLFSGGKIPKARIDRETQTELASFVASADSATGAVVELLQTNDVVLIGETGYVSQHVGFAAELIPVLDAAGIHHLGYQYANREDQALIDQLLTSSTFDELLARRILFNHLTVLGFQEHVDVFQAAWEVNRRKSSSAPPFRIIALSNRLNYGVITSEDDVEDAAIMHQVFATGIPDTVMAQIIATEFLDKQVKAAAYMQLDHAFTGLQRPAYAEELATLGFTDVGRTGNLLRAEYGDRVVTAALHGPIRNAQSRIGFGYPTGSILDNAVASLETGHSIGFRVDGTPFANLPVYGDDLTAERNASVTLLDFADAYLVIAPLKNLTSVTPIPDFITEANVDEAVRDFPGVSPQDATVQDMNDFIAGNAEGMTNVFSEFK
jgi:hypothetical protein